MTSGAGYQVERRAPRWFTINPHNHSGRRLYRLVGTGAELLVTNACPQLQHGPNDHGTPDPIWLAQNLRMLIPFNMLLVCGKVAQDTYDKTDFQPAKRIPVIRIPHPAARMWTRSMLDSTEAEIKAWLS